MSDGNTTAQNNERGTGRGLLLPDLNVTDNGRVTVPARARERVGLSEHDLLDITVWHGEDYFECREVIMRSDGRVRIPSRRRKLHDIEDGDTVDVIVGLRGETADAA
jgi:AbrB family looped-hinge helix DNA binding protein